MNPPASMLDHRGVAEQGKVLSLRGRHDEALAYYRMAMRLATEQKAPQIVLRHYAECSLESLEWSGAYQPLIECCEQAIEHYRQHPPTHELSQLDQATAYQRQGVAFAKAGRHVEAREALRAALDHGRQLDQPLPLAETVLRWIESGLHLSPERITKEQQRHRYFSVRQETVAPERATPLPAALLHQGAGPVSPSRSRSK